MLARRVEALSDMLFSSIIQIFILSSIDLFVYNSEKILFKQEKSSGLICSTKNNFLGH